MLPASGASHSYAGQLGDGSVLFDTEEERPHGSVFWIYVAISISLVCVAGLMSGLTIGLMAMDALEMEVLVRGGTDTERKYAAAIQPVRCRLRVCESRSSLLKNHHYLLVTLVLWNAMAMEALPLFLDRLADPVTAVLLSVTVVLIFGEIVPQSICTRYGLVVGYYSCWLVRILMIIVAPIAWPVGKILDYVLGHEDGALERAKLQHFVALHGEEEGFAHFGEGLTGQEVALVNSALDLTAKTARTAMTPLDKVFMLSMDDVLDEDLMQRILKSGHSRVPVHAPGDRTAVLGLILVKELLLKARETTPVSELQLRTLPSLSAQMPMYDVLQLFKTGRSHMALLCDATDEDGQGGAATETAAGAGKTNVHSNSAPSMDSKPVSKTDSSAERGSTVIDMGAASVPGDNGDGSRSLEGPGKLSTVSNAMSEVEEAGMAHVLRDITEGVVIGIITIEDVIEELIGDEIVDETDTYIDNLKTSRVNAATMAAGLPDSLRTLLSLGFITPRVGIARDLMQQRSRSLETGMHVQSEPQMGGTELERSTSRWGPRGRRALGFDTFMQEPLLPLPPPGARAPAVPATVGAGARTESWTPQHGPLLGDEVSRSVSSAVTQAELNDAILKLQAEMQSNADLADAVTVLSAAAVKQSSAAAVEEGAATAARAGAGGTPARATRPPRTSYAAVKSRNASMLLRDRHAPRRTGGTPERAGAGERQPDGLSGDVPSTMSSIRNPSAFASGEEGGCAA